LGSGNQRVGCTNATVHVGEDGAWVENRNETRMWASRARAGFDKRTGVDVKKGS
jgi:hypothetical protein